MANDTSGPLSVREAGVSVLNDRLRKVRDELDALKGLKGAITLYDSVRIVDSHQQVLHCWGDSGLV